MTPCSRPIKECLDCGDTLIHQTNRQEHESSSGFGQYVHDRGLTERRWSEIFWLDIDGIIFKKRTRILRIIEHKDRSGGLRPSQEHVLPLLAKAVQLLAATLILHKQSGVFVAYSDHPHHSAWVQTVSGWQDRGPRSWSGTELSGSDWEAFLLGEPLDAIGSRAA